MLKYLIPIIGVVLIVIVIVLVYYYQSKNANSLTKYLHKNYRRWSKKNITRPIRGVVTNDVTMKFFGKTQCEIHQLDLSVAKIKLNLIEVFNYCDLAETKSVKVAHWEAIALLKRGKIAVSNKAIIIRVPKKTDQTIFYYQINNLIFIRFKLKIMLFVELKSKKGFALWLENDDCYYLMWFYWQKFLITKVAIKNQKNA